MGIWPYQEEEGCSEAIDLEIKKVPANFASRERRGLNIAAIVLDPSNSEVFLGLVEEVEAPMCVLGKVHDPEVGSNADDTGNLYQVSTCFRIRTSCWTCAYQALNEEHPLPALQARLAMEMI